MAARKVDTVRVEAIGLGSFDRFTSFDITQDMTGPSEAAFEIGDDESWAPLRDFVAMGQQYRVFVNNQPILTGRVEARDIPIDPGGAATVRFTVRTKLADAMYASANPKVKTKNVSIKQFLLQLYEPLGYTEADFVFDADVSRNLVTGKSATSGKTPTDLEPIKEEQAGIQPPEAIYFAADRHLRRHGFMHWDSPDGKIVVGSPNDEQAPSYTFRMVRGQDAQWNNVLSANRVQDWSEIATILGVFGTGGKQDYAKAKVRAFAQDQDVQDAGFYRPVLIISEGLKTKALAERAARRELSARSKQKDAWEVEVDGLSFWDGSGSLTNYAKDTVAEMICDAVDGAMGSYYVHKVQMKRSPSDADKTSVSLLKKGIWVL